MTMEQVFLVLKEEGWLEYLEVWRKYRLVLNELQRTHYKLWYTVCSDVHSDIYRERGRGINSNGTMMCHWQYRRKNEGLIIADQAWFGFCNFWENLIK